MRNVEDVKTDRVRSILAKINDKTILNEIAYLNNVYADSAYDKDFMFADSWDKMEPHLKHAISRRKITEDEMDCLINFYGSLDYDEDGDAP